MDLAERQRIKFDILLAHNKYRALHAADPLALDEHLSKQCQHLAEELVEIGHWSQTKYWSGTNTVVYHFAKGDRHFRLDGNTIIDEGYEEMKNHKFEVEDEQPDSYHFAQIVWKATRAIGIGVARTDRGRYVVVVTYTPGGNVIGHYRMNVVPVGGEQVEEYPNTPEPSATGRCCILM